MNLYEYLINRSSATTARAAKEAKEAYERFQAHGRLLVPTRDCDPFVFAFVDYGYQAFTFKPDQVVRSKKSGSLAIVTGWREVGSGWRVRAKTANGEFDFDAEDLAPAAFPEGLVELMRGRVHSKVDEAFKEDKHD